ncbi:MAG: cytochrome c, partial [Dehalococcoidia bacterium]|nr:cytochrome c [Dehalococcoidia bacterium]
RGRSGTPMPAFGAEEGGVLTYYQIRDITDFIRHWDDEILEEKRHELIEHGMLTLTPTPAPLSAAGPDGLILFKQLGCAACHTIEGVSTSSVGPDLTNIASVAGERQSGTSAEGYIKESLLNPGAFVVEGFDPVMPSFDASLMPDQLQALVDYLLSLE